MERNEIPKFPVLIFKQVDYIVLIHAVGIYVDSAKIGFNSLTLAKSRITTGTDYPLT